MGITKLRQKVKEQQERVGQKVQDTISEVGFLNLPFLAIVWSQLKRKPVVCTGICIFLEAACRLPLNSFQISGVSRTTLRFAVVLCGEYYYLLILCAYWLLYFLLSTQLNIVAKTAGMHHGEWVENADRWVSGFLEKFEEGCHLMVSNE